jgi:Uma2 family endonuclease
VETAVHKTLPPARVPLPPPDRPEIECIRGIEIPKVSPRRRHALLQGELVERLRAWAQGRGEVGTEWRFRLVRSGPDRTSLVPDVAYVARERMASLSDRAAEEPPFAPDIAIEIRSPGDRERNIRAKAAAYLAHGAAFVLDVDPDSRRLIVYDARGSRVIGGEATFAHEAAPGFSIALADLFAILNR